jgi:hypothetical protein
MSFTVFEASLYIRYPIVMTCQREAFV